MMEEVIEEKKIDLPDGTEIFNYIARCHFCSQKLFYYMKIRQCYGKVIGGKAYCLDCYPKAVDIHLADKRLLSKIDGEET
jgi:hypothetical protein